MEKLSMDKIAEWTNGKALNIQNDIQISSISTDSRKHSPFSLFVPIRGANFDGHDFIENAFSNGAVLCLSSKKINNNLPYILVEDTLKALGALAKKYLESFNVFKIAVIGSSGKTSTKDLIFECLKKFNAVKTQDNMNNTIGLPLNIFQINRETKYSIMELGMNRSGEMEYLSDIYKPDAIVITEINNSHIGNFNSFDEIIDAKFEIFNSINNCFVLANGDNDYVLKKIPGKIDFKTFGLNRVNDYYPSSFQMHSKHTLIRMNENDYKINIPGMGAVYTFLAAYSIIKILEINIDLNTVLEYFKSPEKRMHIIENGNITLIDDSYNANPSSMKNALDVLSRFDSRKAAVLSDMLELGSDEIKYHKELSSYINETNIDLIISIGELSKYYTDNSTKTYYHFKTKDEFEKNVHRILVKGDTVLIKGSRGMKMEEIVNFILEYFNDL